MTDLPAEEMSSDGVWRFLPAHGQLRRVAWWIPGIFLIQLFAGALSGGVQFMFWLFIALPAMAVWTLALFAVGLIEGWQLRSRPFAALATAALMPLAAYFLWQPLGRSALLVHFALNRPSYDRVVSGLQRGAISRRQAGPDRHDPEFHVDDGPPLRVTFPTASGMPDNWAAVVYDPTGSVRQARGFGKATPDRVRYLFGGDLVACWHLSGSYYMCGFS